ncbi:MAG TPA: hypothetical protein VGE74_28185 [Gemmata sp.]
MPEKAEEPVTCRWNNPEEDDSFAEATLTGLRNVKPAEPFTGEEKTILRDLMLRAAETRNAEAMEKLKGFTGNPLGFREFLRTVPAE